MTMKAKIAEAAKGKERNSINNHRELWATVGKIREDVAGLKVENRIALALLAAIFLERLFA